MPVWVDGVRRARLTRSGAGLGEILDLGLESLEARDFDLAERLCMDMTRRLPGVLAGTPDEGVPGKYRNLWFSPSREQRWAAVRDRLGLNVPAVIDIGLDAHELRRGDLLAEFRLQVARDLRARLAEYGLAPYPDPDAEHDRDLEYVRAPKPLRASSPPLRTGTRPAGLRFRGE